jgi:hypothetical protein
MGSVYFILGLLALGGLFWLGSLNYTTLRMLLGFWSLALGVLGLGLIYGGIGFLLEVSWTSQGLGQGFAALMAAAMATAVLYAAYRLGRAAISRA